MLWKWSAVTLWPMRNPLQWNFTRPYNICPQFELPTFTHILLLCHFTSISNLISGSKLHKCTKIYLVSAFYAQKNLSSICILWIKTATFGEDTEKDSFLSLSRTHLLSVSTSFYHGTGFENRLGLEIPINSAQRWDLSGFAPSLINNLFLNHILQHLTVWQNISHFSITASHDIQWVTCEYHLQSTTWAIKQ